MKKQSNNSNKTNNTNLDQTEFENSFSEKNYQSNEAVDFEPVIEEDRPLSKIIDIYQNE